MCKRLPFGAPPTWRKSPGMEAEERKLIGTVFDRPPPRRTQSYRRYCRQDCSSQSPGTRGEACCIREELAIAFPSDVPWRQHTHLR